ncbi:hypothetical protein [Mycoplasmopsis bovigenitalium]|uniref:hypothetical protein n=1 Tax=Mycoplasmopsis bovigenitalium TaxID=2112 RepID=UPI000BBA569D|nr:hypothetical protein [Mycoplasmopsis bovigenitalium]
MQNKAQLEKSKQNAINEINKLNINNKEQLIDEINKKDDEAGIRSIVAKAKGDVLESEKLEAESKIKDLDFISNNEKTQKINQIKNTTNANKEQINKIVEELTNKNKEKQDLFDKNIKNNDLFTNKFIDETKNKLVNEDNKDKYNKIKNDFATLKTQKEDLINKLDNKATFPYLGEKDKQNLKNKLKQAIDSESIKEVEKEASQLNADKQKLISEVDKLEKVEADKASTKEQIINANGKNEAQKIYDELKVKSNKEKENSKAAEYNDSIKDISDKIEDLKLYNQSITSVNLKQKNNELIGHLEKQVTQYKQEYKQNLENNSIQEKGKKLKLAKDIIKKYVDTIKDSLNYINNRAENDSIKSDGWEEFYNSTIKHNKVFFDGLTKTNLENYSINGHNVNRIMPDVYFRTKYKIFKKEILRLIGNGKWRVKNGRLIISFMYLDNKEEEIKGEENVTKARPTLDKTKYNSKYNNLTINWNTYPKRPSFAKRSIARDSLDYYDPNKIQFKRLGRIYDYHAWGISFKSGDNDGLELDLKIIGMPNDKNYIIPLIYIKEDYESKKDSYNPNDPNVATQNFDTNVNKGDSIKEDDLIAKNIQ